MNNNLNPKSLFFNSVFLLFEGEQCNLKSLNIS